MKAWSWLGKIPRDEISNLVVICFEADRQTLSFADEEASQIRHAAMVDIGVRAPQPPSLGIGPEGTAHVQMNALL